MHMLLGDSYERHDNKADLWKDALGQVAKKTADNLRGRAKKTFVTVKMLKGVLKLCCI